MVTITTDSAVDAIIEWSPTLGSRSKMGLHPTGEQTERSTWFAPAAPIHADKHRRDQQLTQ